MAHAYYVLTGPTSAGKTELLLRAAEGASLLVVSADSRQVYRHMDIGTGKATEAQRAALPHRVVDVADPGEEFSAFHFVQHAAMALRESRETGRTPWICGGTGLYIRSLIERLAFGSAPRRRLRAAVQSMLKAHPAQKVAERLSLKLLEEDNPVRVVRAAENACENAEYRQRMYEAVGLDTKELALDDSESQNQQLPGKTLDELEQWACGKIHVLDPGKEALEGRIRARVGAMFSAGLLEEVEELRRLGYGEADVVREGIAYREACAVLAGTMELEQAIDQAVIRTRQYAKRQRTYFRGQRWLVASEQAIMAAVASASSDRPD